MATNLVNKNVLITAGPTWVAIDNVRVISNIATGETGVMLAEELAKKGAKVTLLLGPGKDFKLAKNIKVIKFKFFDELSNLFKAQLKRKNFAVIIHSAAVADYKPVTCSRKKISSSPKYRRLILEKTPKLISALRSLSRDSLLIGFKFEPDLARNGLLKAARLLIKSAKIDLAVANSLRNGQYLAFLVDTQKERGPFSTKIAMARKLADLIGKAEIVPEVKF